MSSQKIQIIKIIKNILRKYQGNITSMYQKLSGLSNQEIQNTKKTSQSYENLQSFRKLPKIEWPSPLNRLILKQSNFVFSHPPIQDYVATDSTL
jgi:hypothetical protein